MIGLHVPVNFIDVLDINKSFSRLVAKWLKTWPL